MKKINENNKNITIKIFKIVALMILVYIVIIGTIYFLTDRDFTEVDPRFKTTSLSNSLENNLTNEGKGSLLVQSIYNQLDRELDSTLGWTVNDVSISKYFDNRENRQKGILFATRMIFTFYSTELSKLGKTDNENELLKTVREKEFAYSSDVWGFFVASSESKYKSGISNIRLYEKDLIANKAVFNMRSDNVYELLKLITGPKLIDQTMGYLIQKDDEVSFTELDDRVYYAQGVALVVRDVMNALIKIYPEILEKGGEKNILEGLSDLDKIVSFNPIVVLRGSNDSMLADHRGKVAKYLIAVDRRIEELMESLRK